MVKGFSLNDKKVENSGINLYFEELLAWDHDIWTSEKVFGEKDIYATSIDYNPKYKLSINFFLKQFKIQYILLGFVY